MKRYTVLLPVMLMTLALDSMAARVEYAHPEVTIVAVEEPLESVLTEVGKEMQITVTVPKGVNPVVNCDIQQQSVQRAFKQLLGDLSYSLTWEEGGEHLAGLVILSEGDESSLAVVEIGQSSAASVSRSAPSSDSSGGSLSAYTSTVDDYDPSVADHEAQMEVEREEREARMAEEREAHEAEMAVRRQEQEIVHEARMREDIARKKEEEAVLFAEEAARRP